MINEPIAPACSMSVEHILEAAARLPDDQRHRLISALIREVRTASIEPLEIRDSNGMLVGVVCDPSWISVRTSAEQESLRAEVVQQIAALRRDPETWRSIGSVTVEEAFASMLDQPRDM